MEVRVLKNFLFLTIAGTINAIGVTMFLAPMNLYDSGISGTSILFSQITPRFYSLSLFLIILNIPLFLYGLKKKGMVFTFSAIYSVCIYSLVAFLINDVLPIDVSFASPLAGQDLLLCAMFGGLISGIGSGMAIRNGGAMDGIEVLSVIFAKKLGVTVGMFIMIYNLILYIICGIILDNWILPLYSIVAYTVAVKAVDFLVEGIDRSKAAMIIIDIEYTKNICSALSKEFEDGITILDGKGFYSGDRKEIIYMVLNRFQITRMKEIVHNIDRNAYITITEIADVF
ncbi:membrane protein [Streptococcus porcinus]|uniref:YitT family protein n=1 Tax=Streptococcus TaxID=1301 RepID=UPI0010CACF46|nr:MULTISPECIES: YitT family protein [Streptococcus]MEC4578119.1 YitT family protein [Streptococcus dysgalactiae]VTS29502.1 membrane protein [Streptococcus porcinus]